MVIQQVELQIPLELLVLLALLARQGLQAHVTSLYALQTVDQVVLQQVALIMVHVQEVTHIAVTGLMIVLPIDQMLLHVV